MGSFCNLRFRREGRGCPHEVGGKRGRECGVGLQGFEFAERAMEAALDAGLVAGETVELGGQPGVVEDVEVASGGGG